MGTINSTLVANTLDEQIMLAVMILRRVDTTNNIGDISKPTNHNVWDSMIVRLAQYLSPTPAQASETTYLVVPRQI